MLAIFESILPVFLLVVAGNLLRRAPMIDQGAWRGLEQLGYWFLYPALLFITIFNADFSGLALDAMIAALLGAVHFMCLFTYYLWPLLDRLRPQEIGEQAHEAIARRATPFGLYAPLNEALDLAGRAALGMGLIVIGAGLRPGDLLRPSIAMLIPVVLKLLFFPLLLIALALMLGVTGDDLAFLALCAAVPTAMNGYLLARQLGGDAELYAAVTTLQTAVSFFTIPAMLALAQFVGG